MPIRAYYLTTDRALQRDLSEEQIKAAFESGEGLLWVDVTETTEEDGKFLERVFKFHQLTVEDCASPLIHPPKIDDFDDYLFIVLHGINHVVESDIVETAELALFLGHNFVVSNHNFPLYSTEAVRQQVENDGRPMKYGADFLAHTLADTLIDNVLPTIDQMSDVAQDIEEATLRNPQPPTLEAILKLKRSTLRVHRVMAPQQEVLNRLSRGEFPIIRAEAHIYYRDIYDHLVRIEDLNQTLRDRTDNALATYLSAVANRQNEVMKVLSIIAAIFLPLTLVAGIYGMNFEYMPELKIPWAYFAVLGLMAFVIIGVIWWFWARNWIAWGRKRVSWVRPFVVSPDKLIGYVSRRTQHPRRNKQ